MKTAFTSVALSLAAVATASAQIVTFNFNGASGLTTTWPVDIADPNLTVSNFQRNNLTAASATGEFNSSNWSQSGSPNATKHVFFTVTPDSGFQMTLTSFSFLQTKSSTGPAFWSVSSSLDGHTASLGSGFNNLTSPQNVSFNLGTEFENLTQAVEFRIFAFNATSPAGTLRFDNVILNGEVNITPVPEPEQYALAAAVGLIGFALWRRRQTALAL